MGQVNRVLALPSAIRQELDRRLRAAGYGDLVAISAWVTEQAYPLSKSGLHRYALGLKATDLARGNEDAQVITAIRNATAPPEVIRGRKAVLLVQLARLEIERARLLAELTPLLIGEEYRDTDEAKDRAISPL